MYKSPQSRESAMFEYCVELFGMLRVVDPAALDAAQNAYVADFTADVARLNLSAASTDSSSSLSPYGSDDGNAEPITPSRADRAPNASSTPAAITAAAATTASATATTKATSTSTAATAAVDDDAFGSAFRASRPSSLAHALLYLALVLFHLAIAPLRSAVHTCKSRVGRVVGAAVDTCQARVGRLMGSRAAADGSTGTGKLAAGISGGKKQS